MVVSFGIARSDYAYPGAVPIPQFGSPGIAVNPQNLSFDMDSPNYEWEKIEICIYCPANYKIERATIELEIPETFDYKVNTDLHSIFSYDPLATTFLIEDFGDYNGSAQCDWFEIRPRIDSTSKKETIHLSYTIEYTHLIASAFFKGNESSDSNHIEINIQNETGREYESQITVDNENFTSSRSAGFNVSSPFEKKSVARDDNISIAIKRTDTSVSRIIQENVWFIAVASLICSILLLVFGPGTEERIEAMKRRFRR